jgi:hypothetical protein
MDNLNLQNTTPKIAIVLSTIHLAFRLEKTSELKLKANDAHKDDHYQNQQWPRTHLLQRKKKKFTLQ